MVFVFSGFFGRKPLFISLHQCKLENIEKILLKKAPLAFYHKRGFYFLFVCDGTNYMEKPNF